ncbi:MAG: electron transport complex subunit RsxA [Gammaproteobacteria bacterium]|nr:electron transport complex subunit RsxA [Gammaproteobacteria bacterium]
MQYANGNWADGGFGLIILVTVLVNNAVLSQFLGLCPFMGASRRMATALGLSVATGAVLVLASAVAFGLDRWVLQPLDAVYLRTLAFIFAIAAAVQAIEVATRAVSPLLHRALGIYLPLITTNCAVLGIALLSVRNASSLMGAVTYAGGSAVGFGLVMVVFTALRERVDERAVPALFRGAPIALVGAGILSLAFMGFTGLDTR